MSQKKVRFNVEKSQKEIECDSKLIQCIEQNSSIDTTSAENISLKKELNKIKNNFCYLALFRNMNNNTTKVINFTEEMNNSGVRIIFGKNEQLLVEIILSTAEKIIKDVDNWILVTHASGPGIETAYNELIDNIFQHTQV